MRKFAKRLIQYEADEEVSAGPKTAAGFEVCEKLRPHLATLMGDGGYRALLGRALALADEEVPSLREVRIQADGSLAGWEELRGQIGPVQFIESIVVLVAQLLGLLVAFIGENLTLHLVRDIWPKATLNDAVFGNGDKNEKTK